MREEKTVQGDLVHMNQGKSKVPGVKPEKKKTNLEPYNLLSATKARTKIIWRRRRGHGQQATVSVAVPYTRHQKVNRR
jgi:hypothetical protein